MSGRVLYIFTPPPGVPFRFKSKRGATQPSQVTNSNHVTAASRDVRPFTHSRWSASRGRSVWVCVFSQTESNANRVEGA